MTGPWTPDALKLLAALRAGDESAAFALADALAESLGGGPGVLAGLLCAYASAPCGVCLGTRVWCWEADCKYRGDHGCGFCRATGYDSDPADRLLLAAYHDANGDPGRAAEVRGLSLRFFRLGAETRWYVHSDPCQALGPGDGLPSEPAARAALKRAVLALHDGGAVPCGACGGEPVHPGSDDVPRGYVCGECHGKGRVPLRVPCPGCGGAARGRPPWDCRRCKGAGEVPPSGLAAPTLDASAYRVTDGPAPPTPAEERELRRVVGPPVLIDVEPWRDGGDA